MALFKAQVGEISRLLKPTETIWELEWRIPDFVSLMDKDQHFYFSPTFSIAGTSCHLYSLVNLNYLHLGLFRKSTNLPISLTVSIGIKTLNGKKDREVCTERSVTEKGWEKFECLFYLKKTELLRRKSDLLPLNILTVFATLKPSETAENAGDNVTTQCTYCRDAMDPEHILSHEKKCLNKPIKCPECSEITELRNWYEHECQKTKPKSEPCASASSNILQENEVLSDFKEFFLKQEDCDVVIKVQGREFHAHQTILKARSPVLASTFRNDMKEKATGVLEIEDCDPSSFSDFLCFLYCGDIDVISKENVLSLFTAADKYDVQDLRKTCLMFMKNNLSVDTFCETIALALRHSETELIKLTTDFFIENAKEITVTVKWQSFLAENPTESNELIVKLLATK